MARPKFQKVVLPVLLFSSHFVFSQLTTSGAQLWEKTTPSVRDAAKCKDENLLNFHCGIKDKLLKKYIKYSKKKAHTLSLVHTAKDVEAIWQNSEKDVSLSNDNYQNGSSKNFKLQRQPSIFTFMSSSDPGKGKTDSLNIKFEDQNLYEMIFIPKRLEKDDLNNIHSYLSIKYGISLEKSNYYNSEKKVIWNPDQHKDFRFRPTGLGRDNGNELYQKQSTNTEDQILTIGKNEIKRTNAENTAVFNNLEYVIWSDDNKGLELEKDGNFSVLKRNWEINFIGDETAKRDYYIRIPKSLLNTKALPAVYWLFIKSSSGEIRKIQGIADENYILFNKVDFIPEKEQAVSTRFTFAVSPAKETGTTSSDVHTGNSKNGDEFSINPENIILYPNPVKKGQNFTLRFPPMENLSVSIYDGAGRLIALDKVDRNSNHYFNQLPIQSSYIINLTQNGKTIKTFKLIVE